MSHHGEHHGSGRWNLEWAFGHHQTIPRTTMLKNFSIGLFGLLAFEYVAKSYYRSIVQNKLVAKRKQLALKNPSTHD